MELDEIKRGLRAEIKKREKETYFTCETNVRDMCTDVLKKLEEQESEIAELKAKLAEKDNEIARHNEAWNRLCKKYNKFVSLKQEFCEKFKDIELEIDK